MFWVLLFFCYALLTKGLDIEFTRLVCYVRVNKLTHINLMDFLIIIKWNTLISIFRGARYNFEFLFHLELVFMKVNIEDHVPIKCMVGLWINLTIFSIIRDYIHGPHNNER